MRRGEKQIAPTRIDHHVKTCFCFARLTSRFHPACSTAAAKSSPSAASDIPSPFLFLYSHYTYYSRYSLLAPCMRPELQQIAFCHNAFQRIIIHDGDRRLPTAEKRICLLGKGIARQLRERWTL